MSAHWIEYATLAATVAGLVAVLAEILVRSPSALAEMVRDVRAFAEPSRPTPTFRAIKTQAPVTSAAANANELRHAA